MPSFPVFIDQLCTTGKRKGTLEFINVICMPAQAPFKIEIPKLPQPGFNGIFEVLFKQIMIGSLFYL